jgi:hypothetical protein
MCKYAGHMQKADTPHVCDSKTTADARLQMVDFWRRRAHLAVLFLGMMEWISTRYHILSSGQKSCMHMRALSIMPEWWPAGTWPAPALKATLRKQWGRQKHTSACRPFSCGVMSLYVSSLPVGSGASEALALPCVVSCVALKDSDKGQRAKAAVLANKADGRQRCVAHRLRPLPSGLEVPAIHLLLPCDHLVQGGVLVDALEEAQPVTVPSERQSSSIGRICSEHRSSQGSCAGCPYLEF